MDVASRLCRICVLARSSINNMVTVPRSLAIPELNRFEQESFVLVPFMLPIFFGCGDQCGGYLLPTHPLGAQLVLAAVLASTYCVDIQWCLALSYTLTLGIFSKRLRMLKMFFCFGDECDGNGGSCARLLFGAFVGAAWAL